MAHQSSPTLALLTQLEADHFLPAPSSASVSHVQLERPKPIEPLASKRTRQRVSRACDSCRRMKIKCVLESNTCEACTLTARPCTFEDSGTRRERPPTKKDIEDLTERIKSLEQIINCIAPEVDLASLPRTADQARRVANAALSRYRPNPVVPDDQGAGNSSGCFQATLPHQANLDEAIEALASLSLDSGRYLGSHGNLAFLNQPTFTQNASYDPDLDSMIQDSSRSVVERTVERCHRGNCPTDDNLPPADLAHSLISLYFSRVQPFTVIVHREYFLGLYGSGLINKDLSFKALCYAMFAAASPYSCDKRVLCSSISEESRLQTAGARYAAAAVTSISPATLPCTLFDLQAMAVLSHFYLAMSTPTSAWLVIGSWVRRVQDVGVHVENMPRWCTSILKDQLRKRAFWYMVMCERVVCMSLGRTSCIFEIGVTVERPLAISDDTLAELDSRYPGPVTPKVREECRQSGWNFTSDTPLACSTAYWGIRNMSAPYFYKIWSTNPSRIIPRSSAAIWGSSKLLLSDLAAKVDDYLENSIPPAAKWIPDRSDDINLIWTANLHCTTLNIKMMAHRHMLHDAPNEIETCIHAARAIIDIMDHVHTRGLLDLTPSWSPYKILPAALICLYAACRRESGVPRSEKLVAWADVHRCINLFSAMAPKFFLAQQLRESLNWLVKVCIEDILSLKEDAAPTSKNKKRRHPAEEPLPSEKLLRNIFASNQKYATPPTNTPSTAIPEPTRAPLVDPLPSTQQHHSTNVDVGGQSIESGEFQALLDHLLSLPTDSVPPADPLGQCGRVKTWPAPTLNASDPSHDTTRPASNDVESYLRYLQPSMEAPQEFLPTSYSPTVTSTAFQTWPSSAIESSYPPPYPFVDSSETLRTFYDTYVPPLQLDSSFFQLDLTPSFASVNFTNLPATSSPLINHSGFHDFVSYLPDCSQPFYPPVSTWQEFQ